MPTKKIVARLHAQGNEEKQDSARIRRIRQGSFRPNAKVSQNAAWIYGANLDVVFLQYRRASEQGIALLKHTTNRIVGYRLTLVQEINHRAVQWTTQQVS